MAPVDDSDEDGSADAPPEEADDQAPQEPEEEDLPEVEPDADGWADLMDGKVRKKVLAPGSGSRPKRKQDVVCNVEVRAAGAERSEVLQRYDFVRYRLGEGVAAPMLELALRHMREGEEAEVFGVSSMAWGPAGLRAGSDTEKPIPTDADISMRVKLIQVLPPPGSAPPVWNDMIQEVTWRKASGNDHFKRQDYQKALRCYAAGVEVFSRNGFDPPANVQEAGRRAARAAAMSIVADCGANLAAVHLELGDAAAAKQAAADVLDMRPGHVKALYRMARACLLLDDFAGCERAIQSGLEGEPGNAALLRVDAELRHKQKRYAAKSKRLAGRVFEGLDYPDEPPGKKAPAAEEEPSWPRWAYEAFRAWFVWQIAAFVLAGVVVAAAMLAVLPQRHWPKVFISFVVLVPGGVAVYTGLTSEEDEDEKGRAAKKRR